MRGRREERIEAAVDRMAAALFGLACGWIASALTSASLGEWQRWACVAASAIIGYLLANRVLQQVAARTAQYPIRAFSPRDLDLGEQDELLLTELPELLLTEQVELVLTDADRVAPAPGLLVLDDVLAELGPESRVVRLFDPAAMPSPRQLNARIEQHLRDGVSEAAPPDASQALHDALAELRRSLG
jgi:hypothetical protein